MSTRRRQRADNEHRLCCIAESTVSRSAVPPCVCALLSFALSLLCSLLLHGDDVGRGRDDERNDERESGNRAAKANTEREDARQNETTQNQPCKACSQMTFAEMNE